MEVEEGCDYENLDAPDLKELTGIVAWNHLAGW
jgi:hypothetical protein